MLAEEAVPEVGSKLRYGLRVSGQKGEAADAVVEACVEAVGAIAGVCRGGKEDNGMLQDALESLCRDLSDGVPVGVHFVDVLAGGHPEASLTLWMPLPAVFGVEGVELPTSVRMTDFDDDVGPQVVGDGAAFPDGVGGVVKNAHPAVSGKKINGRGVALKRADGETAGREPEEVVRAVGSQGEAEVEKSPGEGEPGPVFVEGGGIAVGEVKGTARTGGEGLHQFPAKGQGGGIADVKVGGNGMGWRSRGDTPQRGGAKHAAEPGLDVAAEVGVGARVLAEGAVDRTGPTTEVVQSGDEVAVGRRVGAGMAVGFFQGGVADAAVSGGERDQACGPVGKGGPHRGIAEEVGGRSGVVPPGERDGPHRAVGDEPPVGMFEDTAEGVAEAAETDLCDLEEIERGAFPPAGLGPDPRGPGRCVGESSADGFQVGPHGPEVGFVVELGGADVDFRAEGFPIVEGDAQPDAARAVTGVEAAPEGVFTAEKPDLFGVLTVDFKPEASPAAPFANEEVVFGLFK